MALWVLLPHLSRCFSAEENDFRGPIIRLCKVGLGIPGVRLKKIARADAGAAGDPRYEAFSLAKAAARTRPDLEPQELAYTSHSSNCTLSVTGLFHNFQAADKLDTSQERAACNKA